MYLRNDTYISIKINILEKIYYKIVMLIWEKAMHHEKIHPHYNMSNDVQHESVTAFEGIKKLACTGHSQWYSSSESW